MSLIAGRVFNLLLHFLLAQRQMALLRRKRLFFSFHVFDRRAEHHQFLFRLGRPGSVRIIPHHVFIINHGAFQKIFLLIILSYLEIFLSVFLVNGAFQAFGLFPHVGTGVFSQKTFKIFFGRLQPLLAAVDIFGHLVGHLAELKLRVGQKLAFRIILNQVLERFHGLLQIAAPPVSN